MFISVVRKEVGRQNAYQNTDKTYKGEKRYLDSLVENKRINGKVIQTVKANLEPVTKDQIHYLKAVDATQKSRLVYDDD